MKIDNLQAHNTTHLDLLLDLLFFKVFPPLIIGVKNKNNGILWDGVGGVNLDLFENLLK